MSPPSFCVMSSPYSTRDELSAGMVPNLTTPLRKLAAGLFRFVKVTSGRIRD